MVAKFFKAELLKYSPASSPNKSKSELENNADKLVHGKNIVGFIDDEGKVNYQSSLDVQGPALVFNFEKDGVTYCALANLSNPSHDKAIHSIDPKELIRKLATDIGGDADEISFLGFDICSQDNLTGTHFDYDIAIDPSNNVLLNKNSPAISGDIKYLNKITNRTSIASYANQMFYFSEDEHDEIARKLSSDPDFLRDLGVMQPAPEYSGIDQLKFIDRDIADKYHEYIRTLPFPPASTEVKNIIISLEEKEKTKEADRIKANSRIKEINSPESSHPTIDDTEKLEELEANLAQKSLDADAKLKDLEKEKLENKQKINSRNRTATEYLIEKRAVSLAFKGIGLITAGAFVGIAIIPTIPVSGSATVLGVVSLVAVFSIQRYLSQEYKREKEAAEKTHEKQIEIQKQINDAEIDAIIKQGKVDLLEGQIERGYSLETIKAPEKKAEQKSKNTSLFPKKATSSGKADIGEVRDRFNEDGVNGTKILGVPSKEKAIYSSEKSKPSEVSETTTPKVNSAEANKITARKPDNNIEFSR